MMMGGIAEATGFSAHELLAMSQTDLLFWWNAIMAYREEMNRLIKKD